jgi:hypothetical protein
MPHTTATPPQALLDEIAQAALTGDALTLRQLTQDWLKANARLKDSKPPESEDHNVRVVAAAVVELLADRLSQNPPSWTTSIGGLDEPLFLLKSASSMRRLRELCISESPPALRRRNLFAPGNFLTFV